MKYPKLFLAILSMGSAQANELDEYLKESSGGAEFVIPAAADLQALKDRLKLVFKGDSAGDWGRFALQQTDHQSYDTLQELPKARQGRGLFAIKKLSSKRWLLQAPHADSDLHTGKIASRLFLEGEFKAVQWNTVKRSISDMAHVPNTYWQAFTQAFAEQYPDGKIIQIHGYDQDKRKSDAGKSSDMILSAGHKSPPVWIQNVAQCLKQAYPQRVSLYPYDIKELGGTRNAQGQLLHDIGHDGFLHIEISKKMREELLASTEKRKQLLDCL